MEEAPAPARVAVLRLWTRLTLRPGAPLQSPCRAAFQAPESTSSSYLDIEIPGGSLPEINLDVKIFEFDKSSGFVVEADIGLGQSPRAAAVADSRPGSPPHRAAHCASLDPEPRPNGHPHA
ncbi:hypothetical protein, partial [Streptomyces sp. SID13666]|uniref:hypothetical protein n=1 Tax=Streptomyces sp. SID13666 TaxID=2706054 RepID=UPI001944AB99